MLTRVPIGSRLKVLKETLAPMTQIGHNRPGVVGGPGAKPGLRLAEANARATQIAKETKPLRAGAHFLQGAGVFQKSLQFSFPAFVARDPGGGGFDRTQQW